ncbi:hypothetical protein FQN52_000642 [Onygenales sp. PD_12]|nr:hypothetical protein FQN52_000642 [Onygenales sp. PD_12]
MDPTDIIPASFEARADVRSGASFSKLMDNPRDITQCEHHRLSKAKVNLTAWTTFHARSSSQQNIHFTIVMATQPQKYEPFKDAQELSDLMLDFFRYFSSSHLHSFPFEWLCRMGDVQVVCQDCRANSVSFPISPALQNVIENCEYINSPRKTWLASSSANSSWAGYVQTALSKVGREVKITHMDLFTGPLFERFRHGYIMNTYTIIRRYHLFQHQPDHWTCVMHDRSASFDEGQHGSRDYLLRTELLASTAVFYRQMNVATYEEDTDGFSVKLKDKQGPLAATIVTFCPGKVRVVQAMCNPADPSTKLTFHLMVDEVFSTHDYKRETGHKVLKWILSPPGLKQTEKTKKSAVPSKESSKGVAYIQSPCQVHSSSISTPCSLPFISAILTIKYAVALALTLPFALPIAFTTFTTFITLTIISTVTILTIVAILTILSGLHKPHAAR